MVQVKYKNVEMGMTMVLCTGIQNNISCEGKGWIEILGRVGRGA